MMMNLYAISLYLITCLTSVNANTIFTGSLYIGVVRHLLTGLYISVGEDYGKNIILSESVVYFDCKLKLKSLNC